jgi:hypothetical protein
MSKSMLNLNSGELNAAQVSSTSTDELSGFSYGNADQQIVNTATLEQFSAGSGEATSGMCDMNSNCS